MSKLIVPDAVDIAILDELEKFLSNRVIGQEIARGEIIDSLNVAIAGLNPPNHPFAILMFPGPTGTGKTELVRALADYFYDKFSDEIKKIEEDAGRQATALSREKPDQKGKKQIKLPKIVKIDCGRFAGSMSHAAIDLLGAPTSYVGREQPPILSQWNFPPGIVRVLLFDEIEKAYIDSRDYGAELTGILMALLDEARIQNNRSEDVYFTWTIVAFTTNLGARDILKEVFEGKMGFQCGLEVGDCTLTIKKTEEINKRIYSMIRDKLKSSDSPFPPELMNRIDRISVFRFLSREEYKKILEKEMNFLRWQLGQKSGISLQLSSEAGDWIIDNGIDLEYGVRSLQRFLRRKIREPLARLLNAGMLKTGDVLEIQPDEKDLSFSLLNSVPNS